MASMFSCRDMTELASQAMDRSLPLGTRAKLRFHLLMCKLCNRYNRHLRYMRELITLRAERGFGTTGVGPRLSEEAKERIRVRMEAGSGDPNAE